MRKCQRFNVLQAVFILPFLDHHVRNLTKKKLQVKFITLGFIFAPQLEFEVVGAGGKNSHVTVDDIYLSAHPCEDQGLFFIY